MSLLQSQILSSNQISSIQLSSPLRYIYFRFSKKITPYWNSTSGFDFNYITVITMLFCIRLPNIIYVGPPRHIDFSRWQPRPLNTTSGFVFIDVAAFRKPKSISKPNSSTYLNSRLRYNYFRFRKTNVRHIVVILSVLYSTISS